MAAPARRAGETVYRLTNIVRAEQPDALFAVPPDYDVREGGLATGFKKLELLRRWARVRR